jgi:hypothetical protein
MQGCESSTNTQIHVPLQGMDPLSLPPSLSLIPIDPLPSLYRSSGATQERSPRFSPASMGSSTHRAPPLMGDCWPWQRLPKQPRKDHWRISNRRCDIDMTCVPSYLVCLVTISLCYLLLCRLNSSRLFFALTT